MAPKLDNKQRREYLSMEREFIEELLEDTTDCKWVYQASIELALLEAKLEDSMSQEKKKAMSDWIEKLKLLDPLRRGRWEDMESSITASSVSS